MTSYSLLSALNYLSFFLQHILHIFVCKYFYLSSTLEVFHIQLSPNTLKIYLLLDTAADEETPVLTAAPCLFTTASGIQQCHRYAVVARVSLF